jgi:hypothetical protein
MKALILAVLTLFSIPAMSGVCDLSTNDQAVQEVNDTFNRGEMRGEDHALALKLFYTERLELVAECVSQDLTKGLTKQELEDTIVQQEEALKEYVEEMNESIRISIEHDRIGMATALTMERDEHIQEVKALQDKIRKLIKELK